MPGYLPINNLTRLFRENKNPQEHKSFFLYLKKAWQDTFLPLTQEREKDTYHFGHYFMGWPSKPNASKIAYFLTLKFITTPLTNLLSLVIELPLNLLSETSSFLKNSLLAWTPTNGITQHIRSLLLLTTIGLQGLLKGACYLIRTITSPIVSFKDAQKIHPALGWLSALASVLFIGGAIAALIFFAPPLAAALIPSMGPSALTVLSTLAYPFAQLFSLIAISIPAATGAMLSFITGTLLLGILHQVGRKIIYPEESQSEEHHELSVTPAAGSNVSNLLSDSKGPTIQKDLENDFTGVKSTAEKERSSMLDQHFGKKLPSTKKNPGDGFNHKYNQATIDV
ncbi:hypothetical protein FOLKNPGA_00032 [Legionella sp. PC1000]|uniref:hypothetical protein n=1 Tax=Legionella sp. PC1000 TaxID=2746060 RepID=UPI0015FE5142|nr:hypothetical protein [Legionella sp. PC1000]QLZ67267.1 hypothetical protein FOLKNPGA_00032 [Legionella sp. PC1000]